MVTSVPQSRRARAEPDDGIVDHAAVDAAPGEVGDDVRHVADGVERVRVITAAADVREDERDGRMPRRESREVDAIGDLLRRPFARAVLPDVVQHRKAACAGEYADGVEQRIVRAAAGEQLHADRPALDAAVDLVERMIRCGWDSP